MEYFAKEAAWSFALLLFFGIVGLGPMLLFKNSLRFHVLASPLAGLLLVSTSTLPIYFVFFVPYSTAALCAAGIALLASIIFCAAYWKDLRAADIAIAIELFAVAAICFAWFSNAASIRSGSPSIVYFDGTDHLGYANVAEWMKDHIAVPGHNAPGPENVPRSDARADPAHPFESMPNIMLNSEPRNGAFGFLALISLIRQLPSTFAYDPASGVFLSAAILGVAAVFARTGLAFAILALGLVFSMWYEFSHAGYFGKTLAFPTTLCSLGLFFAARQTNDLRVLFVLLMMCVGSALLLSGVVTAAILASFGGSALLISCIFDRKMDWNQISRLTICVLVSVLAGGFFVHPVNGFVVGGVYAANFVAPRALDLEGWTAGTTFEETTLYTMIAIAVVAGIGASWVAFVRRSWDALSLLLVPIVIYIVLLFATSRVELLQTTGLLYPAMLCGFGILLSELRHEARRSLVILTVGCALVTVVLRWPHASASVRRYTSPDIALAYTKKEMDEIAKAIGDRSVLVDTGKAPHPAILMLVELGRRGLALQWTADAWWNAVGSWRGWPLPKWETPADFRIVRVDDKAADMSSAVYSGRRFAVVRDQHEH
jgi:hypothetical protein